MAEPVTRLRAGAPIGTDAFGQPIPGPDVATDLEATAFDPGGSTEQLEVGRAPVVTTPKVYFRGTTPDILHTDRLRVRGVVYDVDGKPAVWLSPWRGTVVGTVVTLSEPEG